MEVIILLEVLGEFVNGMLIARFVFFSNGVVLIVISVIANLNVVIILVVDEDDDAIIV